MEKICVGWHEESYTNIWSKKYNNWSILCISRKPVHTIPEVYFEKVGKSQKFQKVTTYFVEECHPNFEEISEKSWTSQNTLEPKQLAVKLNKQWVHATMRADQLGVFSSHKQCSLPPCEHLSFHLVAFGSASKCKTGSQELLPGLRLMDRLIVGQG